MLSIDADIARARSASVPCVWHSPQAAANIEIEGTDISASTLHNAFDLDAEGKANLDFSKPALDKVAAVLNMKVLFLDEAAVRFCVSVSASVRGCRCPGRWGVGGGSARAGQHDGCRGLGEDLRRPFRR